MINKISLLTPTLWSASGIDRVVQKQAEQLHALGYQVTVICLENKLFYNPQFKLIELGLPQGLLLQRIYRLLFFLNIKGNWRALQLLRSCDLVIAHQYPMTIFGSLAKFILNKPYIYWEYGIPPLWSFNTLVEKTYILLFSLFTKLSIGNADLIVAISHFLGAQHLHRKRTKIVYPDVTLASFTPNNEKELRKRLLINDNFPIILFVGRLSPHKGVHLLIDAFIKINLPSHLIIVGKPTFHSYFTQLQKQVGNNRYIHFLDSATDEEIAILMKLASVYASASLWEGFNIPLFQANQLRKKVVAFSLGAHTELISKRQLVDYTGNYDKDVRNFSEHLLEAIKH